MVPRATGLVSRGINTVVLAFVIGVVLVFSAASAAVAATPATLSVRLGGSAALGTANLPNFSTLASA